VIAKVEASRAGALAEFWGPGRATTRRRTLDSIRGAVRIGALILWTIPWASALALGLPRAQILRRWSRGVARLLGMRITVKGAPPSGAFLLVANHLSYVDIVLLASQLEARFVAKQEVASWPGIGKLARAVNTLFVDRRFHRGALQTITEMEDAIRRGEGVVLFGEGTSSAGEDVLPIKSALLSRAAETSHPVHYATLSYMTPAASPPASEAVCWWGKMTLVPHLLMLASLPGFRATLTFGAGPLVDSDRRRLADRLRQAIRTALPKTPTPNTI
jgi:1-acyl-sn-glycerol-3-phosphate acyltransferase